MQSSFFRAAWLLAVLAFTALACQALSGARERASSARETVEFAATKIDEGRDLLGTAQALTTQVAGENIIPTAQALATQLGESGIMETARAVATEQGPGILSTAMAIATQQGPSALATAQAYVTQVSQGTPAEDIPVIEGNKEMFFQSARLVSYLTSLPYDQVLEYYKTQMPARGWVKVDRDGFETGSAANLVYEKDTRRAMVSIGSASAGGKTVVVIVIEG